VLEQVKSNLSPIQHSKRLVSRTTVLRKFCLVKEQRSDLHHLLLQLEHVVKSLLVDDTSSVLVEYSDFGFERVATAKLKDQSIFECYSWGTFRQPLPRVKLFAFDFLRDLFVESRPAVRGVKPGNAGACA